MSVLMIFVDGLGIGSDDVDKNPLARFPSSFLSHFSDRATTIPCDGLLVATDPTMGIAGLPQSATGQTALLTGVNASQALGHHLSGFPSPTLREIIRAESIFLKIERMQLAGTFANAFTPEYFSRPDRQISATTWSVKASQFPFRMVRPHLWEDQAISHDLTNSFLARLGYDVPKRDVTRSAQILVEISQTVDFCLFEFILTDMVGHSRDMEQAGEVAQTLDQFLKIILAELDLERHLVLLTSDHGNFEDLSVSTHTENFVPTILWGKGRSEVAAEIRRLQDVPRAILSHLNGNFA